jgi:phosphatidylserine/phosphatidylglycerophosphate/cardiolipin synthase-like enzyme
VPPSLPELKSKWFLDFSSQLPDSPPIRRYDRSNVTAHTDGNLVTPLIDGQSYMKVWHDSIQAMISRKSGELYHSAWLIQDTRTLGETNPQSNALIILSNAERENVKVYLLASMHTGSIQPEGNRTYLNWLRENGVQNAYLDNRFPLNGSNHLKNTCFKDANDLKAILGSIDISRPRWDTNSHAPTNPDRPGMPSHDLGIMIRGPAVADIERSFRDRWNDSSRLLGTRPQMLPDSIIGTPVSNPVTSGSHSIQLLHTYGIARPLKGYQHYSWGPNGEFTIWASYLNAIKKAQTYIYIEDQYFFPFGYPPCFEREATLAQKTDLVYQLGKSIEKGVKVAVLVPENPEDALRKFQKYQRDLGVSYLTRIAASLPAPHSGDFTIAYLHNNTSQIYVHSKLMIIDDEFVLVGSANFERRSMTHDGEMHVGILDAEGAFARNLRKELWQEHLQASVPDDPITAYAFFKQVISTGGARIRSYPTQHPGDPPIGHSQAINTIDRYAGPPEMR